MGPYNITIEPVYKLDDLKPSNGPHPNYRPEWVLHYTILNNGCTQWLGSSYEFFNDEPVAKQRYMEKVKDGTFPTLRKYSEEHDRAHLGICY